MKPWTKHDIKDFSEVQIVETNTALISKPDDVKPLTIEAIGAPIPHKLKALIINGRKLEGENYTSRSEATFAVMTGLARMGVSIDKIAGVCINPEYAISERFLEKHQPEVQALREANRAEIFTSQDWRDVFKDGRPRPTFRNAYIGIIRLGIICTYDEFKNRLIVGSAPVQQYIGELSDKAVTIIRKVFLDTHDYDPFSNNIRDGLETLALENTVHPLKTYFTSLKWDGIPRIRGFFTNYMGADNTELNRAVAFIMLVAAIRRVFDPGCKFDTMVVLEGKQGSGKSTALKILASEEFFSDQDILSADNKTQMELLEGVWIYEVCELSGLKHTDTAKLKSFLSRQEDRGRPAYGRYKEVNKRQSIFVGTTNDENYLKDRTGNRRFIPVKTGKIDLVAIKRDRDQIWAEAVYWEEQYDCWR